MTSPIDPQALLLRLRALGHRVHRLLRSISRIEDVGQDCLWEIENLVAEVEASGFAVAGRSASPSRPRPHGREHDRQAGAGIRKLDHELLENGSVKVWIDERQPFVLPPLLGRLLVILARSDLGESDDPWVSWKTPDQVSQLLAKPVGRKALNQAVHLLRRKLIGAGLPPGLVQRDRGRGLRLLLQTRRITCDAR
jgi:hypothetical protein